MHIKNINVMVPSFKTISNLNNAINKYSLENPVVNCWYAQNDAVFKEEEIGKFCTRHKTFCTLSPPIPQLSASIGLKNLFHIL